MSAAIKKLSDSENRDGYEPTYGVTFPGPPFFKCSAAHRQSPSDHCYFIESHHPPIDCMVDMRDFPNFKYHEPPSSGGYKDFNKWFGDWQKWHEAKILAVAKFFHLQHCQTCLYNMIREKYFPGYPVLPHPKDN